MAVNCFRPKTACSTYSWLIRMDLEAGGKALIAENKVAD